MAPPPGGYVIPYDYGAVFVFERTSPAYQPWLFSWKQTQKLQASDKDANWWQKYEQFGYSVAVSPDRIAVGAPTARFVNQFNSWTEAGAVYVFSKPDELWKQKFKRTHPLDVGLNGGQAFGYDVAVDKMTGVFGIPFDDVQHPGSVLSTTNQGSAWVEELIYFEIESPANPRLPLEWLAKLFT